MTINLSALQKQRRDSAANWTAENPTLLAGEIGIESDTGYWKVGDGSTAWTSLAYVSGLGAEIPVDRLADGTAGQIIQTDSAGTGVEWSSTANLPLGSASAPAYRFQGDANTGIYSPGADQLAISTNGTGRLFIASNGDVGVGQTSPGTKFHVNGGTVNNVAIFESTDAGAGIILTDSTGSSTLQTNGAVLQLGVDEDDVVANSAIAFRTDNSERLRITSDGKLGLGTSSPGRELHISGAGTSGTQLQIQGTSASAGIKFIPNSGDNWEIQTSTANDFLIYNRTDEATRFVINGSGNVGIGTSSVSNTLQVVDSGGTTGSVDVGPTANQARIYAASDGIRFGSVSNHDVILRTNNTERARIDSSGRLLVGTSSDSQVSTLVLQGNSGAATDASVLRLCRGANNPSLDAVLGYLTWGDSGHTPSAWITGVRDTGTWTSGTSQPTRLVFSTTADGASSPTERMRVNRNGVTSVISTETTFVSSTTQGAGTSYKTFSGKHSGTTPGTGTETFLVWSNGDVANTNNTYGAISDIKLKENIVDANSQWNDLKALQVRNYNFKEGQTHTQIGLIAQEVELVSPGLVSESPDRDEDGNDLGTVTKSVNYSVLYMKAVKALQEAMERIEVLEAKVNALEGN